MQEGGCDWISISRKAAIKEYLQLWFGSVWCACWVLPHQRCWLPPPWTHNPPRGSNPRLLLASSVQAQNQELELKNLELWCMFCFVLSHILVTILAQRWSGRTKVPPFLLSPRSTDGADVTFSNLKPVRSSEIPPQRCKYNSKACARKAAACGKHMHVLFKCRRWCLWVGVMQNPPDNTW